MASSIPTATQLAAHVEESTAIKAATVPWYVWCSVFAVTSAMVGLHWDISWHASIGRDTFWTPAHMAIYLCGVLAGVSCGYLILATTFGGNFRAKEASVKIWGFRGPLGAFVSAWGGITMLASAPFDNWWHNAYGLDVKILSPPHVVLIVGILSVELGSLILILGSMNRAQGKLRERLKLLFQYVGAMILVLLLILVWEYTSRVLMHSAIFYSVVSLAVPLALVGIARASGDRWGSTIVIGIYSVFWLAMLWILPLFPAEPKLGPVYQRVTHLIPMGFPLLLIVPAFFLDILWAKLAGRNKWLQAALAGAAFLLTLVAVQWPFASFLMSAAARNWFFGSHYFAYLQPPTDYEVRNLFYSWELSRIAFWRGMAVALVAAILTTRLGISWGDWMRKIRR